MGLVTNWQAIGDAFQRRLDRQNVAPPDPIGRYSFQTAANTAAVVFFMLLLKSV